MAITLQGLTWDDPRGHGPMAAVGEAFSRQWPDELHVVWDIQPLGGFESAPLAELVERYDLLVIDHPHMGEAVAANLLLPVSSGKNHYVGETRQSYVWQGRAWAVPIDGACHVAAFRRAAVPQPLTTWEEVFSAAEQGLRLATPLGGVHSLMALLTLLASQGVVISDTTFSQLPSAAVIEAASRLRRLARLSPPEALDWNPIEALRALCAGRCDYVPLTFGYAHFQSSGIGFGPVPAVDADHPPRAILGGAGMAVSAHCQFPEQARAFVHFCSSRAAQTELWPRYWGQPAHAAAWDVLAMHDAFYRDTRSAHETAFVRPRFAGWNELQSSSGQSIQDWLRADRQPPEALAEQLDALWKSAMNRPLPQDSLS